MTAISNNSSFLVFPTYSLVKAKMPLRVSSNLSGYAIANCKFEIESRAMYSNRVTNASASILCCVSKGNDVKAV